MSNVDDPIKLILEQADLEVVKGGQALVQVAPGVEAQKAIVWVHGTARINGTDTRVPVEIILPADKSRLIGIRFIECAYLAEKENRLDG